MWQPFGVGYTLKGCCVFKYRQPTEQERARGRVKIWCGPPLNTSQELAEIKQWLPSYEECEPTHAGGEE